MSSPSTTTGHDLVATVERFYELECAKRLDEWAALWAEDCHVLFPLTTRPERHEIHGKEALVAATAQKFVDRERTRLDVRIERMADGRRVVAHLQATIHFAAGPVWEVPLLIIFTFDDAGLITTMEEYLNEVYLEAVED